jgi:hypothetical protein
MNQDNFAAVRERVDLVALVEGLAKAKVESRTPNDVRVTMAVSVLHGDQATAAATRLRRGDDALPQSSSLKLLTSLSMPSRISASLARVTPSSAACLCVPPHARRQARLTCEIAISCSVRSGSADGRSADAGSPLSKSVGGCRRLRTRRSADLQAGRIGRA